MIQIAIALAIILIAISVSVTIYDLPSAITEIATPAVKSISEETSNMISYIGVGIALALVLCSITYIVLYRKHKNIKES